MAFVNRSPKNSYFDETAISSLKNDVTNLSSFLGQDESTIYNENCIKEASFNSFNQKQPFKGRTFQPLSLKSDSNQPPLTEMLITNKLQSKMETCTQKEIK